MSELAKFRRSLANHPGLSFAGLMTLAGATSGATGRMAESGHMLAGVLFGAGVAGLSWVPVLWTAWTLRHQYADDERQGGGQ